MSELESSRVRSLWKSTCCYWSAAVLALRSLCFCPFLRVAPSGVCDWSVLSRLLDDECPFVAIGDYDELGQTAI